MKAPSTATGWLAAGAVIAGLYFLAKSQAAKALQAVNPLNQQNIFNQGANATFTALTGSTSGSIGSSFYGATHDYLRFPDGTVKTYTMFDPADVAEYYYDEQFNGGVPSDATGSPLPGG